MLRHTRIISLGEIITPNFQNAIDQMAEYITQQNNATNSEQMKQLISNVFQEHATLLEQFNQGEVQEQEFDNKITNALSLATKSNLSIEQFNEAWLSMHPSIDKYRHRLDELNGFSFIPNHQIILVSDTSPKDIRHLRAEFDKHGIEYKIENGHMTKIGKTKLYTTHQKQLPKAKLIEFIITKHHDKKSKSHRDFLFFSPYDRTNPEEYEAIYICGVNNIEDPHFKKLFDDQQSQIETASSIYNKVKTLFWDKKRFPSLSTFIDAITTQLHSSLSGIKNCDIPSNKL